MLSGKLQTSMATFPVKRIYPRKYFRNTKVLDKSLPVYKQTGRSSVQLLVSGTSSDIMRNCRMLCLNHVYFLIREKEHLTEIHEKIGTNRLDN